MRFLADMAVSFTTVEALRAADHDAVHLRDEGLIRLPDPEIAAKAVVEGGILHTFDLDFGDILAIARSQAPSVVIFRLRNQTPAAVNPRLFHVIDSCATELEGGFPCPATSDRVLTLTARGSRAITLVACGLPWR